MERYEMPWRPNFEAMAAGGWAASAATGLVLQTASKLPLDPFLALGGMCGAMALLRGGQAVKVWRRKSRLVGRRLEFLDHDQLAKIMRKFPDRLWLGQGFPWGQQEAQRCSEIMKRDPRAIGLVSDAERHNMIWRRIGRATAGRASKRWYKAFSVDDRAGAAWIHGVGDKEERIVPALSHFAGHLMIFGTTGAGKTRLFDLLVTQAVLRGECVIIVDPKGDGELRENARKACEMAGKPEAFAFFHPAFPRESVRINPLKNFNRPMEVASRIAALIPSETGADPFKAFGQMALNNVIQGLLTINETPLLTTIKRYLEAGVEGLVLRVIDAYCTRVMPNWAKEAAPFLEKTKDKVAALTKFYHAKIAPDHPSPDLEGLLAMAAHNKDHLTKMIASLNPIMSMLTSGELGPVLSPRADDMNDPRPILDLQTIIKDARVLYIGLDSLSDPMVGSSIGAMLLSDLTTVAGDRYNYVEEDDLRPVNIFVDEASETVNDPFLQMLNKGRGAKYRLIAATQTLSDFVTRTGSEDKAYQLLGNLNNMIVLRVIDAKTQKYVAETLGTTKIQYIMTTQGSNVTNEISFGGNAGERLMEEEAELFPSPLLGRLPNLEFIAMTTGGKVWKGRVPILGKEKL